MFTFSITIWVQMALEMYISSPDPSIIYLSTGRPQGLPKPFMSSTDLRIFLPKSGHLPMFHRSRWHFLSIWLAILGFGKFIFSAHSPLPAPSPSLHLYHLPETMQFPPHWVPTLTLCPHPLLPTAAGVSISKCKSDYVPCSLTPLLPCIKPLNAVSFL